MALRDYFENKKGTGVLATASANGEVDVAIYARPHFIDDDTVAFIMSDRLSHSNLNSNPHAAYLFVEEGNGYEGKRLHLTKLKEETDPERIQTLRRRTTPAACQSKAGEDRYLVHFHVDRVRPLVGHGDDESRR